MRRPTFHGTTPGINGEGPDRPDAAAAIRELRGALEGRIVAPGDPDYDHARAVYFTAIDRRPAAIVRPSNADEVAPVLAVARDSGLELAVRGGGHGFAGPGVVDGGLVLDLRGLDSFEIDPDGRTAWAGGGLTTGAYTVAAGAHGLATGFGDAPSVGIGGITLGGGLGFLHRKHGLTIDSLLAAEVVTADGRRVHTDADTEPELFWAIRGGGGNFGVATRFRFRLHEVDRVLGGMLMLPADEEVLVRFIAELGAAPDELSGTANVMVAPSMPMIPPEHHGRTILFAWLAWAGDLDAGARALERFRTLAPPVADTIAPVPYARLFEDEGAPPPPAAIAARSFFLDEFDRAHADAVLDHLRRPAASMNTVQVRPLGGAVAQVAPDDTAFAHRYRSFLVNPASVYTEPAKGEEHAEWATSLLNALCPDGQVGAYVGFMGEEGEARVREAYPDATRARLARIKARWDPDNLFRRNQNVAPAKGR